MGLGVSPKKMIYANPVKEIKHIQEARRLGVNMCTFDSLEEIQKLKDHHPQMECVLRIATKKSNALYNLSDKYGA